MPRKNRQVALVASTRLVLLQRTVAVIARGTPFVMPEQYITATFLRQDAFAPCRSGAREPVLPQVCLDVVT
jgi:hypothetical protein